MNASKHVISKCHFAIVVRETHSIDPANGFFSLNSSVVLQCTITPLVITHRARQKTIIPKGRAALASAGVKEGFRGIVEGVVVAARELEVVSVNPEASIREIRLLGIEFGASPRRFESMRACEEDELDQISSPANPSVTFRVVCCVDAGVGIRDLRSKAVKRTMRVRKVLQVVIQLRSLAQKSLALEA